MAKQSKPRKIRVAMMQEEHDVIRLAAALQREPMTVFCQKVIVAEARRVVDASQRGNHGRESPK